jgi:hypothetical protein
MGKSTRGGRVGRSADVIEFFPQPHKSKLAQVVGLLIRSRAELFILAVGLTVVLELHTHMDWRSVVVVSTAPLVVVFTMPYSRRFVVARVWCVLDRHRLRSCLRQTKIRTMNMDGSLPFMLWARPTKTGERIWLWIRAGSSGEDIEAALSYIAPACYAREARLHRVRKLTTLVAVEVIRRDPLGKPEPITSTLATFVGRVTGAAVEGTDPIQAATVTDITTRSVVEAKPSAPGHTTKVSARPPAAAVVPPPVVRSNGEDLSDYID